MRRGAQRLFDVSVGDTVCAPCLLRAERFVDTCGPQRQLSGKMLRRGLWCNAGSQGATEGSWWRRIRVFMTMELFWISRRGIDVLDFNCRLTAVFIFVHIQPNCCALTQR